MIPENSKPTEPAQPEQAPREVLFRVPYPDSDTPAMELALVGGEPVFTISNPDGKPVYQLGAFAAFFTTGEQQRARMKAGVLGAPALTIFDPATGNRAVQVGSIGPSAEFNGVVGGFVNLFDHADRVNLMLYSGPTDGSITIYSPTDENEEAVALEMIGGNQAGRIHFGQGPGNGNFTIGSDE